MIGSRLTTVLLTRPTVLAAQPTPDPVVGPTPGCQQASELCGWVFDRTGLAWLADGSYYLLVKPFTILLILIGALIARYLIHKTIARVVVGNGPAAAPAFLRPLRDRIPAAWQEATGLRSERRRQRSEAMGSVLRSIASAVVFTVAFLLILDEVGMNVAPLLASAGIAGVAIGFGAQNLVKDFIAGIFMLLEDQYGVGDVIDVGEASGTVESVGLRVTTIRDGAGVLWYIRNGEIVRVGNKSQGWALVIVDVPVGFAGVEEATVVLTGAAASLAADPDYADDLIDAPQVLGVEQITVDGAVMRTTAKTVSEAQWRIARELRRRLTEALERAGIAQQIALQRSYVRTSVPESSGADTDRGGPT